jgi:DNA-binding Lrp family transcriptional regulator
MDHIDQIIISQLQTNGRTTYQKLAKQIGYTSMGAKKRVKKLIDKNFVKISALINAQQLKLHAAIVLIEIENAEAMHKLIERFRECPRVVHIFTTLGGYNIIALVVAENRETLESISIEKCSLRSSEGIRRSEFYPIGDIHYSPFLPIRENLTHKETTQPPCKVNCLPCHRYKEEKCVGCPATTYYKGNL